MAKVARGRTCAGPAGFVVAGGDHSVLVRVHVKPGAEADGIVGPDPWRGVLVVQVKARPQKGAANVAVCAVVAAALGIAPRDVLIEHGTTSREKTVRVVGVTEADVRDALEAGA